eukprot:TRINITY_DN633_c0_g1_i1.p1 TRINITY_DN633_c0_g1~~TRINITY_DN633_c0_g1_i1.p1  ORF type:complete len:347 (-),score=57.75 TRINITY_DN633_c0_g1_i1:6-1010(-)
MVRWGILTVGKISWDFVSSLSFIPEAKVVACAARDKDRAEEFAKQFSIPKAYSDYEKLAEDPDVDIVYVGSLHPFHLEHVLLCINKGKSVLCEKPLCLNSKEVQKLIHAAKEKKVFLMEAMWSRYLPVYQKLIGLLEQQIIGDISLIQISFGGSFDMSVPRNHDLSLGAGALLDIGIYPVTISRFITNKDPTKVVALSDTKHGVDQATSVILGYDHGQHSILSCSIIGDHPCEAIISGSKGKITIHSPFWCPEKFTVEKEGKTEVHELPFPEYNGQLNFKNSQGLHYQALHVHECLKAGKLESDLWGLDKTLAVMKTLDEIRKQIGVKYPNELK